MIAFRHADPRFPFLREDSSQPAGRWNAPGELTHYFCDTPDGAWAEFLRHEEIDDPEDISPFVGRSGPWTLETRRRFNLICPGRLSPAARRLGQHARMRHDTIARLRTGSPRHRQRYAREVLTAGGWMGGSSPAPTGMAGSSRSSDLARSSLAGLPPRKAARVQNCSRLSSSSDKNANSPFVYREHHYSIL